MKKIKNVTYIVNAVFLLALGVWYFAAKPPYGDGYIALRAAQRLITVKAVLIAAAADMTVFLFCRFYNDAVGKNRLLPALAGAALLMGTAFLVSMPHLSGELIKGHDIYYHLERIEGLAQGIKAGFLPVRVQPVWVNGHGYAVSLCYPDLFLYFPALLRKMSLDLQDAYIIYMVCLNFVGILISYLCFRRMFKNSLCALTGSILYALSEYRYSTIYVRAALGEATAFLFLPMIMCGLYEIFTADTAAENYKYVFLLPAAGFAGLFYSHLLSAAAFGVLTVILCLILIKRTLQPRRLTALVLTALTAVVLAAAFLIPFADAMSWDMAVSAQNYTLNGYPLSGLFKFWPSMACDVYEQISSTTLDQAVQYSSGAALTLGVLIAAAYLLSVKKDTVNLRFKKIGLGAAAAAVLLSLAETSLIPWELISASFIGKYIGMIQFTWRLATPATLFSAVAVMCALKLAVEGSKKNFRGISRYAAAALVLIALISCAAWNILYMSVNVKMERVISGEIYEQIPLELFYCPAECEFGMFYYAVVYPDEGVTYDSLSRGTLTASLNVTNTNTDEAEIAVPLIYYPCYNAADTLTGETFTTAKGEKGLVAVILPAGYSGTISVTYTPKKLWRLAEIISLLSAAAFAVIILIKRHNNGKNITDSSLPQ